MRTSREKIRLRIGNLGKAVLITGQAYQDPKDALNEFVSNAADEYVEAGRRGERIRIVLHRRGRYPVIAIEDAGRGMTPDRLRDVARNLFESSKADDARTLGEKAIGILGFQQLASRCDIVSRPESSTDTHVLRLSRGSATAHLEKADRRRARSTPGTTVYLSDIDPDVLRVLTQHKVVDYMRRRRGQALAAGDYAIEVIEGKRSVIVTPEEYDGIRLSIRPQPTLWGRIDFAIYVAPQADKQRRVAVVGKAGTTIIDDIADIDEFAGPPWNSNHVSGVVVFDALQQTAGRRALLRDREAFPIFIDAVRGIEPAIARTIEKVSKEVDATEADRLADAVQGIFRRVLKELSDIENPMRAGIGGPDGTGGILGEPETEGAPPVEGPEEPPDMEPPPLEDMIPPPVDPVEPLPLPTGGRQGPRSRELPSIAPDPNPDGVRSRFDQDARVVYYNDRHADYLMVKPNEAALLDYLATLVAKELVVYNNPRASTVELGEEMVRMLVRVRRHLPRA